MRPAVFALTLALGAMTLSGCITTAPPISRPAPPQAQSCTPEAATGSRLQRRCPEGTTPMPTPTPMRPRTASCNADAAKPGAIGKPATAAVIEQARIDAGARMSRVLKPGQMVTMEYAEGRLNIDVDARNVIINLRCG